MVRTLNKPEYENISFTQIRGGGEQIMKTL
jgi:hypothetical protein